MKKRRIFSSRFLQVYRTDWYPQAFILSYANDTYTIQGGDLVAGVMDGLISAFKTYGKQENLSNHIIKRKKFINGLILICAVRGKDLKFGGGFGETLEEPKVKSQIKKLLHAPILMALKNNPEIKKNLISRFDKNNLTHKMY